MLPEGLHYLKIGNISPGGFRNGVLPASLKVLHLCHLIITSYFALPWQLDTLRICSNLFLSCPLVLPKTIRIIKFTGFNVRFTGALPFKHCPCLEVLVFWPQFNEALADDDLPASLQILDLGTSFNHPLTLQTLPANLTKLTFSDCFSHPLAPRVLPASLKELYFRKSVGAYFNAFNQAIEIGTFPDGLEVLDLGVAFNQLLEPKMLSKSLKKLEFGRYFNQRINRGVLPNGLKVLKFGENFNYPLAPGVLPPSLECLTLGYYYERLILQEALPSTLREFHYNSVSLLANHFAAHAARLKKNK